ncbi:uncharacterized protein [Chanodichthys erythropterus]|uniref:uncharacterized protein n=1 Tax=Chanodichthys erythropterus TaxID=933992 RepID=UPI00351E9D5B
MSLSMSTTDASPTTIVTPLIESGAATTQTTAVVNSTLLFNSSSPVPSEALVLKAISTLRRNRESQLNDSVNVVNVTYQKISGTSYAVVFTFNLNNISMPVNSHLRDDTYQKVQNTINNALNTLLNDPGKQVFVPKTSNFTSTSNQIDGSMGYTFQDEDVIQPVSFLNELRSQMVSSSTITSFPSTSPSPISGTAVVTSKLLFSSSSPVPSEALVLKAISTLRQNRESQLNDSVNVVNVTYQKISGTSYAVVFTFNLNNISMPVNSHLRDDTYQKVQNTINNALNTLLNDPGKQVFVPKTSNFTSTSNQIDGSMGYTFKDEDVIQPVSFLNELRSQMELTTTTVSSSTITSFPSTSPSPISGTAVVTSKLLFSSSSPVPSEALVLKAISTLRQNRESQLNDSVKVVNVTYQKISGTSYAVVFTFNLNNISMPVNSHLRDDTYQKVQNTINNALNTLLNDPGKQVFVPKTSNFTSTSNQIDGSMGYTFKDEDVIQPVSFLNELRSQMELTTTTVSSSTITSFPSTSPSPISGSAVVTSKLLFSSSSPVPSEALVLKAISTLRQNRESQLNDSVNVVNVTYQKISGTSYAVVFTFNLNSISMPVNSHLRDDTYQKVQNTINNALNTLLNDPGKQVFVPKTSNFTSTSNQIDGSMGYTFKDEDVIQPVSFLNELRSQMGKSKLTTTTVSSSTITSFPSTSPSPISGTAVVTSKLLFSSSSPVPSEALVLKAISTLRQNRESQLNDSVNVVNVTYQKISGTSYAVVFTFNLNNISMPVNSHLRDDTYQKVQNTINNALNTLLNAPGKQVFVPKTSNFTSTSNQIDGSMGYTFKDEDVIQPVSFLNELRSQMELTTTTVSSSTITSFPSTSPSPISGSAVVTSKLLFSSSSPVPSEALVLKAISTLRQNRESQLNDSVKVVNVTYQKISGTSYAVVFTFNLNSISMPVNSHLRDDTYQKVQNTINNALNTLLNDPGKQVFVPKTSNFTSTSNQINGSMGYTFQDGDAIQPVSFLNELRAQTVSTTARPLTTSTTIPPRVTRRVYINIQLVFITVGPIPSEDFILQLVNSFISPRFKTIRVSTKISDASFVNATYIRINDTSYALKFGFEISNVSMSEKIEFRNETYVLIQTTINKLVTEILNDPSAPQFDIKQVDFNDSNTVLQANVAYVFSESNINTNSSFVKEILKLNGGITTFTPAMSFLTTASPLTTITTSPPTVVVKVIIHISLVFKTRGTLPSQSTVLQVANSLLIGMKLRTKRALSEKDLNDLVSSVNVTYTKIDANSFSLNFGFEISNVSMAEKLDLRNETYTVIENYINTFVSKILNKTTTTQFNFSDVNFKDNSSVIEANVVYVFSDSDINSFGLVSIFLATPAPTTAYPTVLNTTVPNNSTNAAWVVAIIVPVAIVLGLIPCWILLCCLLCGCCAAIRRRWHRRQSYNVQYTTRNSLF